MQALSPNPAKHPIPFGDQAQTFGDIWQDDEQAASSKISQYERSGIGALCPTRADQCEA